MGEVDDRWMGLFGSLEALWRWAWPDLRATLLGWSLRGEGECEGSVADAQSLRCAWLTRSIASKSWHYTAVSQSMESG